MTDGLKDSTARGAHSTAHEMPERATLADLIRAQTKRQAGKVAPSRQDAIARGLPYYKAAPCTACGHDRPAIRYASNRQCVACRIVATEAARYDSDAIARRKAAKVRELARRKAARAQRKAQADAPTPAQLDCPMAQLLGTILSTDG